MIKNGENSNCLAEHGEGSSAMDSLRQLPELSSLPVELFIFRTVMMMKTILMVIVFFLQHVDLMEMPAGSPSPSVIWLRNGVLIDSDYTRWIKTDGFGLYQVDKMVINPL